jgi:hypothetical protein
MLFFTSLRLIDMRWINSDELMMEFRGFYISWQTVPLI